MTSLLRDSNGQSQLVGTGYLCINMYLLLHVHQHRQERKTKKTEAGWHNPFIGMWHAYYLKGGNSTRLVVGLNWAGQAHPPSSEAKSLCNVAFVTFLCCDKISNKNNLRKDLFWLTTQRDTVHHFGEATVAEEEVTLQPQSGSGER